MRADTRGDERETLIRRLFPTVRAMARRLARIVPGSELDDLVGDGSIGLIRAVDSFDAARGVTIEHYARRLIAGAMLNGLRRIDPVSERVRRTLRAADAKRYTLAQETGHLPHPSAIEQNDAAARRARTIAHRLTALSIDAPAFGRSSVLADEREDPALRFQRIATRRKLTDTIAALPERQRRLMAMHYYGEIPLRAVSRALKISPQRASQLHLGAIRHMRHALGPDFAHDLHDLA